MKGMVINMQFGRRFKAGRKKNKAMLLCMVLLMTGSILQVQAAEDTDIVLGNGSREFLNDRNRPEADYSQDGRDVFRIIEVIPHDACSIFPYLIDWQTEEEYDRNVPIGYEGLVYSSGHPGEVMLFEAGDSTPTRPFGMIEKGLRRDFLADYNITLGTSNDKSSNYWWREEEIKNEKTGDGYFEYVGEGKGLYYINTKIIKGQNGAVNGINHEVQALPRNGKEKGKGEYEVKEPMYYWAKDYSGSAAYPTEDIRSCTGFNYDIIFKLQEKTGTYRVYDAMPEMEKTADEEGKEEEKSYDYFAKVQEGTEKNYTFVKHKGGNYGKDKGNYYYAGPGAGAYILDKISAVKGKIWTSQNEISFEYAGAGKGVYDVTFIYAGAGAETEKLYLASIDKVSNEGGRYSLTSSDGEENGTGKTVPVYIEKPNGDYSSVITNIDFAGIDYEDKVNGYYATTAPYGAGVRIGRHRSLLEREIGGWVFHEVSEVSEEDYTKLEEVKQKKVFEEGDRIYVQAQKRIYRYYCRNSFRNNEWFKLLCYMDNPENPSAAYSDNSNGAGFDAGMSSAKNLIKAEKLLKSFDNTFRIDVRQRTPGELTREEVEDADLIYVSDTAGIESLVYNWKNINDYLIQNGKTGLTPLPSGVTGSNAFRFEDDFQNDVLLAIYDKCIYTNEVALMTGISLRENYMVGNNSYKQSVKNLGKLTFFMDLMENAKDFAYFIEGYKESGEYDNFNLIRWNTGGDSLGMEVWEQQDAFNGSWTEKKYNVNRSGESRMEECWDIDYFEFVPPPESPIEITWKGGGYTGKSSQGKVLEGETKYYSHWYSVSSFNADELHKIWQILHNRKNKGEIVVQITNAYLTYGEERKRVIYADEFDPKTFTVKYKILLRGVMQEMAPALTDTLIFFDDNDNGICDAGEISFLNGNQQYSTENEAHERNLREGFELADSIINPKLLNPDVTRRKAVIQAADVNGKTGAADVWVVVREGFELN